MGQEGQLRLILINVWIKTIINMVLKPNSGVDPELGSSHRLIGSTRVNLKLLYIKKNNFILTKKNQQFCLLVFDPESTLVFNRPS